jgi:pyrroloquinoline quinone biosynthesis protein E
VKRPYALVAELSYKCPLACAYCSNPIDFRAYKDELDVASWARVFREAEDLGVVQAHLSGGEPLVRKDLEDIVRAAHDAGLYVHLVTSGIPLDEERVSGLAKAGVDAVQVSLQGTDDAITERVAGLACHSRKLDAIRWFQSTGLSVTINVVLHRANIDRTEAIIALAESLGVRRLELANVQTLGWALQNRDALLPDESDVDRVRTLATAARERLAGKMEIILAMPDYFRGRPRACMGGWASTTMVVTPTGVVLPCHAARSIAGMEFPSVTTKDLAWIWNESPAFQHFRGQEWMPEPCKSCPEREQDFGGCRCQAFALTGDAARTDPACDRAPDHGIVLEARRKSARAGGRLDVLTLRR